MGECAIIVFLPSNMRQCWWGVGGVLLQHPTSIVWSLGESHVHSERIVRAYQCTVDTCIHTVTIKDVYTAHLMKTPHHVIHTTILSSSFNTAPTFSNDGPFANSAEAWFPIEYIVASELNDPIWHSLEWQIGSFSSEATIYIYIYI